MLFTRILVILSVSISTGAIALDAAVPQGVITASIFPFAYDNAQYGIECEYPYRLVE
jgi:hypothetical protein